MCFFVNTTKHEMIFLSFMIAMYCQNARPRYAHDADKKIGNIFSFFPFESADCLAKQVVFLKGGWGESFFFLKKVSPQEKNLKKIKKHTSLT